MLNMAQLSRPTQRDSNCARKSPIRTILTVHRYIVYSKIIDASIICRKQVWGIQTVANIAVFVITISM